MNHIESTLDYELSQQDTELLEPDEGTVEVLSGFVQLRQNSSGERWVEPYSLPVWRTYVISKSKSLDGGGELVRAKDMIINSDKAVYDLSSGIADLIKLASEDYDGFTVLREK